MVITVSLRFITSSWMFFFSFWSLCTGWSQNLWKTMSFKKPMFSFHLSSSKMRIKTLELNQNSRFSKAFVVHLKFVLGRVTICFLTATFNLTLQYLQKRLKKVNISKLFSYRFGSSLLCYSVFVPFVCSLCTNMVASSSPHSFKVSVPSVLQHSIDVPQEVDQCPKQAQETFPMHAKKGQ